MQGNIDMDKIKTEMHSRLTVPTLITYIVFGCMFLASANFLNKYYYCVFISFFLFLLIPSRKIIFNLSFIVLLAFSVSILLFNPISLTKITYLIKTFVYPICYIMGVSLFTYNTDSDIDLLQAEKNVSAIIFILTSGTMGHYLLNMFVNRNVTTRYVMDFWTRSELNATGQATMAALMVGVIAAFFFSDVRNTKKIIAVVALILVVIYNLILAGRTLFALIAIMMVFAFLHKSIATRQKILKTLCIVALIALVILYFYNANIFDIKTSFENSNFYYRFTGQDITEDSRLKLKMIYLKHFWDYPFGGFNIRVKTGNFAHDLYLDTYDESGIFALLAIIIYIVMTLVRLVKCSLSKQISFQTRQLIACIYIAINLIFFIEPIIAGMPWLLSTYCFIDGVVTYLLNVEKRIQNKFEA